MSIILPHGWQHGLNPDIADGSLASGISKAEELLKYGRKPRLPDEFRHLKRPAVSGIDLFCPERVNFSH